MYIRCIVVTLSIPSLRNMFIFLCFAYDSVYLGPAGSPQALCALASALL